MLDLTMNLVSFLNLGIFKLGFLKLLATSSVDKQKNMEFMTNFFNITQLTVLVQFMYLLLDYKTFSSSVISMITVIFSFCFSIFFF